MKWLVTTLLLLALFNGVWIISLYKSRDISHHLDGDNNDAMYHAIILNDQIKRSPLPLNDSVRKVADSLKTCIGKEITKAQAAGIELMVYSSLERIAMIGTGIGVIAVVIVLLFLKRGQTNHPVS